MPDTFEARRRGISTDATFVVIAQQRDYTDGRNILRDIITKDEMPQGRTPDRGWWEAQGMANTCGYHLFLYIEHRDGSSCGPVFPIDNGPFEYMEEERGEDDWYYDRENKPACKPVDRDYAEYIKEMQKEGRWQGDKGHPKYPWKGA